MATKVLESDLTDSEKRNEELEDYVESSKLEINRLTILANNFSCECRNVSSKNETDIDEYIQHPYVENVIRKVRESVM